MDRFQAKRLAEQRAAAAAPPVCTECGDPIPEARRNALPHVRVCVDCAFVMERKAS